MNIKLLTIIVKLLILERNYSLDSKASKRCFCNQFENLATEFNKLLIEEQSNANKE